MPKKQMGPGPRWAGDQPRERYSVVFDPKIKKAGTAAAKKEGLSFSMWLENAAKAALKKREKRRS